MRQLLILCALAFTFQASAMLREFMPPPSDPKQCDNTRSLKNLLDEVGQVPAIRTLPDSTLLELLIGASCEATRPAPDKRLMALGEAIFVGAERKKSILFCTESPSPTDVGYAYAFLDADNSGQLDEESLNHSKSFSVRVHKGEIESLTISSQDLSVQSACERFQFCCNVVH